MNIVLEVNEGAVVVQIDGNPMICILCPMHNPDLEASFALGLGNKFREDASLTFLCVAHIYKSSAISSKEPIVWRKFVVYSLECSDHGGSFSCPHDKCQAA